MESRKVFFFVAQVSSPENLGRGFLGRDYEGRIMVGEEHPLDLELVICLVIFFGFHHGMTIAIVTTSTLIRRLIKLYGTEWYSFLDFESW